MPSVPAHLRLTVLGAGEALGFLCEIDAINLRCRDRMIDLARDLAAGSLAVSIQPGWVSPAVTRITVGL